MCLPYRVNDKMKKIMCNNFADVNTYRSYDECIFENNDKNTSLQTLVFSIVIFIVGSISILIIYYNVSVRIFIISTQSSFNEFPACSGIYSLSIKSSIQ